MTIIMIMVAYTVPRQWSAIMQRDRERQTIFIMKQYARAIAEWQGRHGGLPTSLDQLKEARSPRFIRGPKAEYLDPLTGKVDWILIPPGAVTQNPGGNAGPIGGAPISGGMPGASGSTGSSGSAGSGSTAFNPQLSPKDYVGPFVGVRPNKSGRSLLTLNGNDQYEQWSYTVIDLQNEINARNNPPQFR
ncbi:MAG: type II secretion system protein [Acidobacteria bacterium]|nr:type II secretion system protein [Acidobacteriota bacterium]